jgi:hypothetical protein
LLGNDLAVVKIRAGVLRSEVSGNWFDFDFSNDSGDWVSKQARLLSLSSPYNKKQIYFKMTAALI